MPPGPRSARHLQCGSHGCRRLDDSDTSPVVMQALSLSRRSNSPELHRGARGAHAKSAQGAHLRRARMPRAEQRAVCPRRERNWPCDELLLRDLLRGVNVAHGIEVAPFSTETSARYRKPTSADFRDVRTRVQQMYRSLRELGSTQNFGNIPMYVAKFSTPQSSGRRAK